jgi:hypothetical protein
MRTEAMDAGAAYIKELIAPADLLLFIWAFLRVLPHTADVLVKRGSVDVCFDVVHPFLYLA